MIDTKLLKIWLNEDAPEGDITSAAIFGAAGPSGHACIVAKQALVISGTRAVLAILRQAFPRVRCLPCKKDGQSVKAGQVLMRWKGPVVDMLRAERVALNLLQRLSGIATLTAKFVAQSRGGQTRILDTRKMTPGLRDLEKQAVRDGGGTNHRLHLSDAYMIKDNHIAAAGSVSAALKRVLRHRQKKNAKKIVIVEVCTLAQFLEALSFFPEVILLDNMPPKLIRKCIEIRNQYRLLQKKISVPNNLLLEISGGVTLKNLPRYLTLGADRISIGALTHSAPAVDISLEIALTD